MFVPMPNMAVCSISEKRVGGERANFTRMLHDKEAKSEKNKSLQLTDSNKSFAKVERRFAGNGFLQVVVFQLNYEKGTARNK